jgi:hypothetical protein
MYGGRHLNRTICMQLFLSSLDMVYPVTIWLSKAVVSSIDMVAELRRHSKQPLYGRRFRAMQLG